MASRIPVYIISFNNATYVANMVSQILSKQLTDRIVIFDNNTTHKPCLDILSWLEKMPTVQIIRHGSNGGHGAIFRIDLPDVCVITDPDLELHPNLPSNAIEVMAEVAKEHNAIKVGFAIDISQPELLIPMKNYISNRSIVEWESQFWNLRIPHPTLEVYKADIDTTFCLFSKNRDRHMCLRLAGNYLCKHLPWYIKSILTVPEEEFQAYKQAQICSTTLWAMDR